MIQLPNIKEPYISLCIENDNDFEDQVKDKPYEEDEFERVNDEVDLQKKRIIHTK